MENINEQDRMIEENHLEAILSVLNTRLSAAKTESENQREGLNDIRRDEFQERSEPVLRNLWAAHRFEDLVHLSQEFQNAAEEKRALRAFKHLSAAAVLRFLLCGRSSRRHAAPDFHASKNDWESLFRAGGFIV